MRSFPKPLVVVALALFSAAPVWAQLAPGKFGYSAPKASTTPNGYRLDGDATAQAIVRLPQLEVTAGAIAVDGRKVEEFTEVRALGNVNLNITLEPKNGQGEAFHIESKSDKATLTRANRTLTLTGNLSGFYRVGDGPQTMLSGSKATFNYSGDTLNALIESDAGSQVELLLPAEASDKPDALGPVTLRADSIRIDEKNGAAYFTGNAHAFSSSGANKLDVKAPSFTLMRAADGTVGTLTTNGVTVTKLDVPPDTSATGVGKPTHLEVTADKATVNRASSTGVFEGNVNGFYLLQAGDSAARKYEFNGDRVTVTYDAQVAKTGNGLNIFMNGGPANVQLPAFDFKF